MEIHTFVADSAADAVGQIRDKLGPEAVVLNVRQVPAEGFSRLWQRSRIEVLAHLPEKDSGPGLSNPRLNPRLNQRGESRSLTQVTVEKEQTDHPAPEPSENPRSARKKEWRINTFLEESGLLPLYSGRVLQEMQARAGETPPASVAEEVELARNVLVDNWRSKRRESQEKEVHVFAGTPGSGKTTALCKWLARSVLTEEREAEVWRLDGHVANTAESLSIYCEILGVPIKRYVPAEPMTGSKMIFVDLPGINPKDSAALEGFQYFVSELPNARVHLVLNAAYDTRLLLVQARALSALPIADLIFTHLDEEHRWGKLWNFVLGTNYSIRSLSAGQNVPGEFWEASPEFILTQQFRRESPA
jgi:flagellar biosynthesis protein FlhF